MLSRHLLRSPARTLTLAPLSYSSSSKPQPPQPSAATAAGGGVAVKRLTRSNMGEAPEELRGRVREAAFLGLDLEMSGVTSAPWRDALRSRPLRRVLPQGDFPARQILEAMEAAALGLNLSCGFKFDPTDKDLVVGFLLPLVRGVPLLFNGGIIYDDPRSAPPWELLARHGRTEEAIFLAPGVTKYSSGSRRERGCIGGGMWKGQKGVDDCGQTDEKEVIRWRKYMLSYYLASARQSTGWVMHEFELTSPKCPQILLCRVRISEQGKKRRREQEEAASAGGEAAALQRVPIPDRSVQTDVLALEASKRSGVSEQGRQPMANYADAEMAPSPQDPWEDSWITAMQHQKDNFGLPDVTDRADFVINDGIHGDLIVGMTEVGTCTAFSGENRYMGALTCTRNVKQFIHATIRDIGSVAGIVNSGDVHGQNSIQGALRKDGTMACFTSNAEGFINYGATSGEIGTVAGIGNCRAMPGESNAVEVVRKDGTMAGSCSNVDGLINYGVANGETASMAGISRPGVALSNSTAMGEPNSCQTCNGETGYMGDFSDLSAVKGRNSGTGVLGSDGTVDAKIWDWSWPLSPF